MCRIRSLGSFSPRSGLPSIMQFAQRWVVLLMPLPEILCFVHHRDPLELERVRTSTASDDIPQPRVSPKLKLKPIN